MVDALRTAQELPGMRNSSKVKLHSGGIQSNRDGAILD